MTQKQLFGLLRPYILIAIFSPILIYLNQVIALPGFFRAFIWVFVNFPSFLASSILVSAMLSVVYAVFGSFALSAFLCSAFLLILTVTNHLKELINGVPLEIADIAFLSNTGDLMEFIPPGLKLDYHIFVSAAAAILTIVIIAILLKGQKLLPKLRFASGCFCLALLVFLYFLPASAKSADLVYVDEDLGVFLSVFKMSKTFGQMTDVEIGDAGEGIGYFGDDGETDTEEALPPEEEAEPVTPNVIVFVSESFFDIGKLDVEYSKDPLPNFHKLRQDFPGGEFFSNTFSGGTGNVEMEIFVGIPLSLLTRGDTLTKLPDMEVYKNIPTIAREFKSSGYHTSYIHAHTDVLFNRSLTIDKIGFDDVFFSTDFPEDVEMKGGYVSDKALVDKVISEFEANKSSSPQFIYALSMQNHQPFYEGKYKEEYDISGTSDKLDERTQGVFDSLLYGIHDADASLGYLIEYFESCEEPTIIVFLGDHLPGLSIDSENTIFTILGYSSSASSMDWDSDELKKMLSTDYVVWNNYDAEIDAPKEISGTTLCVNLLTWADIQKSSYFKILERFSKDVIAYRDRFFVGNDGKPYSTPPEEYDDILNAFGTIAKNIAYKGYIFDD